IGKWYTLMLDQLRILLDQTIQRHLDCPGPRVRQRSLERCLIPDVVRPEKSEAFGDLQFIAVMIARTIQPRLTVHSRCCNDQDVAFPDSVGLAHPRINRQLRVILHVNDSVRGRERVDHQKIAITLENLERKIMVGYAWNSQ